MAMRYELQAGGKTFAGTLPEIYEQVGVEFLPSARLGLYRGYAEENPGALESVAFVVHAASVVSRGAAYISGRSEVSHFDNEW